MKKLYRFIAWEGKKYWDETKFNACIDTENEHIKNVLSLGDEAIIPTLMLLRISYPTKSKYIHFCLILLEKLCPGLVTGEGTIDEYCQAWLGVYDLLMQKLKDDENKS